jgi:hypothetical protein
MLHRAMRRLNQPLRNAACCRQGVMRPRTLVIFERLQPIAAPVCAVCAAAVGALLLVAGLEFLLR